MFFHQAGGLDFPAIVSGLAPILESGPCHLLVAEDCLILVLCGLEVVYALEFY
jgi:hypothetical protein